MHVNIAVSPNVLPANPTVVIEISVIADMFVVPIMGMLAMVTCLMQCPLLRGTIAMRWAMIGRRYGYDR